MSAIYKIEHIAHLIKKYEESIEKSEKIYQMQIQAYTFSRSSGILPEPPNKITIEAKALSTLARIAGYLEEE